MLKFKQSEIISGSIDVTHSQTNNFCYCLKSITCLTSIRSVLRTNSSSHISCLLPAETSLILYSTFVHLLTYSIVHAVICAADPQPMHDLSPNSNLPVIVVIIDYVSASLSKDSRALKSLIDCIFYLKYISVVDPLNNA